MYRKLNYCYDNFYKAFFKTVDYDSDFVDAEDKKYEDDGIYEDVDTSHNWGMLEAIQEESDSDYYRSLDYCNALFNKGKVTLDDKSDKSDFEAILSNCENYLEDKNKNLDKDEQPKLYPKTISDKIYNFKKDFSNHDYVNVNFNDYENINLDRKTKNDILRQRFFLEVNDINKVNDNSVKVNNGNAFNDKNVSNGNGIHVDNKNIFNDKNKFSDTFSNFNDKNQINDHYNRFNDKKIECHSIRNDVTKTGPDVKVSGSLNMKLLNLDKYNRVLTTTETFVEKAEASFTKNELHKKNSNLESFIKRSEKYYTTESRDRTTTVELNNAKETQQGKTEIRIFYNPTFKSTGDKFIRGFCSFCRRRCPRTEEKCCPRCICLELELKTIWKENWLNILFFLSLIVVMLALLIQCFIPKDVCQGANGNSTDDKCFEMM